MTTSASVRSSAPSRREFLNYAFAGSLALLTAGSCGGLVWFMRQQRFVDSAGSGLVRIDVDDLPFPHGAPVFAREAQAYLSHSGDGLVALLGECPYEHWLVRWSMTNGRFECPLCGSKYQMDGTYIEGPAPRDLDQAVLQVTTDQGTFTTPADGAPVPVEGAQSVIIDVQQRIPGSPSIHVDLPQP